MASLFEAYITNLGKYNEGELVGETLKFPTTTEEVQALLKRIGVDGVRYEEFFITSFDGDVLGLYDYLTEYENLDELNHLACLLSELDQGELEKFEAVIDSGEHTSSVADLINLAQNLDCYEFYPGVEDDETLGRIYVEDMEAIDVPEHLLNYFDYEAYGRDIRLEEDGHFAPDGYVLNNGGQFIEHYHGIEDIPDEHKVFAFPQLTVREQMSRPLTMSMYIFWMIPRRKKLTSWRSLISSLHEKDGPVADGSGYRVYRIFTASGLGMDGKTCDYSGVGE